MYLKNGRNRWGRSKNGTIFLKVSHIQCVFPSFGSNYSEEKCLVSSEIKWNKRLIKYFK